MSLPDSLPGRLYLLACEPRTGRLVAQPGFGCLLRAAALTDLLLAGQLADDQGRPRTTGRSRVADPVLAAVRSQVDGSRPRSWQHWVKTRERATARAVRDQLAADGWVRLEPRRLLGIVPTTRVMLRDAAARQQLAATVDDALRRTLPLSQVDPRDAALVALSAAAEQRTVLTRRQRREHRERITRLTELTGPAAPALRKAVRATQAAASGG
jgi:hypothetical protein